MVWWKLNGYLCLVCTFHVCVLTSDQESSNDFRQEWAELQRWGWRKEKHCFTPGRKEQRWCFFFSVLFHWLLTMLNGCHLPRKAKAVNFNHCHLNSVVNAEHEKQLSLGFLFFMSPTFVVTQDSYSNLWPWWSFWELQSQDIWRAPYFRKIYLDHWCIHDPI